MSEVAQGEPDSDAPVIADLDEEQLRAVTWQEPSLCVIASAGSGKTRVLTRRVQHRIESGSADADHTLVLTFTRKAANELRERLAKLGITGVTAGTFHAVAYAQLKQFWQDNNKPTPVVTTNPSRLIENALATLRLDRSANARACASEIAWAKAHGLNSNQYVDAAAHFHRRSPIAPQRLAKLWDAYEDLKRKRGVVDFDDLLLQMVAAMRTNDGFAQSQRWKFRHLFVDEFQDLNRAQFNLLRTWLGMRDDLFVVGDPDQAIYGFNGADASYLSNIKSYFPEMEIVELTTNYRSTPQVLSAGDAVLGRRKQRKGVPGVAPTLRQYGDEKTEAIGIARQLRLSCAGKRSWSDAAVLVRTNAQRGVIEEALVAANIPIKSGGGASWLHRVELREIVEYLRSNESRKLGEVMSDLDDLAIDSGNNELAVDLVDEFRLCLTADPLVLVRDAMAQLEVASRFDPAAGASSDKTGVTVTTFHRAKGLEWPVVMLAGLEDGYVPLRNVNAKGVPANISDSVMEEERRLLYVAITRAKEELHCSLAATRLVSSGKVARAASPWLKTLAAARIDDHRDWAGLGETVRDARVVLEATTSEATGEETTSEQSQQDAQSSQLLRNALAGWRQQRARLSAVAPHLILADSLIDAIAKTQPSTLNELASVEGVGKLRALELWSVVSGTVVNENAEQASEEQHAEEQRDAEVVKND